VNEKVLLYSGGMDSWLIDKIWKPDVKLYIDINGGSYSEEEKCRLPKDVIIEKLDLARFEEPDSKVIHLRNLYFVMLGSYYGNTICLGATAGDRLFDKSWEFGYKVSNLLSFLYQKQRGIEQNRDIKVTLEFKEYSKGELLRRYIEEGGSLEKAFTESFSCYTPQHNEECWNCRACFRKYISFKVNGYNFPKWIENRMKRFVETQYDLETEAYGRQDETKEILTVLKGL